MKRTLIPACLASAANLSPALDFLPVTDIATPNMISGSPNFPLTNVIEGAGTGFDAAEPHNSTGSVWYTDAPGGFPSNYIGVNPGDEIVILDLGQDVSLYELSFWGYSAGNENGMREFAVRFATDAEGGNGNLGDEAFGTSISDTFNFEAILDPLPRQSFGFGKEIVARYVEVRAISTFFDQVDGIAGGDRLGLGEISFAIPSATDAPDLVPTAAQSLDLQSGDPLLIPIYNTGDSDLLVTGVSFTGADAGAFSPVSSLPFTVDPFIEEPFEIGFDPTGLGGLIEATMVVTSNDPDQPSVEIPLSGILPSLGPDLVVTSPVELLLAETGIQSFDLPVSNVGGSTLNITSVTPTGTDAASVSITSFPPTIGTDGVDNIVISFDPTKANPGALDVTLEIQSDDEVEPVALLELSGGLPVVFTPVAAVATNTVNFYAAPNLIQGIGIGFEAGWPHTGIGAGAGQTWVTDAPNGGTSDYYANDVPDPVIIFDFGSDVPLGEINTWGYAAGNTNGAKDYTLRFATESEGGGVSVDEPGFDLTAFQGNFGNSITYQPSFEAAFSPTARDIETFEQPVLARYVEMTITDNWRGLQGTLPGGDRVGFGEVAFPAFAGSLVLPLTIVAADRLSDGTFSVTFTSTPGTNYEIERSTDGEIWERLPISVPGSPEETTTILDSDPLPESDKVVLYRVVGP